MTDNAYRNNPANRIGFPKPKARRRLFGFGHCVALVGLLAMINIASPGFSAVEGAPAAREKLAQAETYYWFGMAEDGNLDAFDQGLSILESAQQSLSTAGTLEQDVWLSAAIAKRITTLREEIRYQRDIHHDTLYGVFPLTRLLGNTVFSNPLATGTFELVDDPDVVSVTSAGAILRREVLERWSSRPQLNVVFNSLPLRRDLENELVYLFSRSGKFFVHNRSSIVTALSSDALTDYSSGRITPTVVSQLCRGLDTDHVVIMTIRQLPAVAKDRFFIVQAGLYGHEETGYPQMLYAMGFSRDRTSWLLPIIVAQFVSMAIGVGLFCFLFRCKEACWPNRGLEFIIPVASWVFGRILPWIVMPLLGAMAPEPDTLARLSFWWPALLGCVLFGFPPLLARALLARIPGIIGPDLYSQITGNFGAVCASMALGICADLAGPIMLYRETDAFKVIIPLTISAVVLMYILGRGFEKTNPLKPWCAGFALLLSPVLGGLMMHMAPEYLVCFIPVAMFPLACNLLKPAVPPDPMPGSTTEPPTGLPKDIRELIDRAITPPFRPTAQFRDAQSLLTAALESGRTQWIAIIGPWGVGKTETSNQLRKVADSRASKVTWLGGACPEQKPGDAVTVQPFEPFKQALSKFFTLNSFGSASGKLSQIEKAAGDFLSLALPLIDLLIPAGEDTAAHAQSLEDIDKAVELTIRRLSRKTPVVLFIDDVHWIDGDSERVLHRLKRAFPVGGDIPLVVLLTSRTRSPLIDDLPAQCAISISNDDVTGLIEEILTGELGICDAFARDLRTQIGKGTQDEGGLFWLYRVVINLAESGYLMRGETCFSRADSVAADHVIPMPKDFIDSVDTQLKLIDTLDRGQGAGTHDLRTILECAACIGQKFSANVLADSLAMDRLILLKTLERIESNTGVIVDLRDFDDIYEFRSSFHLEKLREKMRFSVMGPRSEEVPQVIREYHFRTGRALAEVMKEEPGVLYQVAQHFYASGRKNALKGIEYALQAAARARREFNYELAGRLIDMATECSQVLDGAVGSAAIETEKLLVALDRAHVTGVDRETIVNRALGAIETLGRDANFDLKIKVIRGCYDLGKENGQSNPVFLERALALSRDIAAGGSTDRETAEAEQFIALCHDTLGRKEDTIAHLRKAYEKIAGSTKDDESAKRLSFRIVNSLAGKLKAADPVGNFDEIDRLLKRNIVERQRLRPPDKRGLAMDHGEMARLHLELFKRCRESGEEAKAAGHLSIAKDNFSEDLNLSRELEDVHGMMIMENSLGECAVNDKDFEGAIGHYRRALDLSTTPKSTFLSLVGLLKAAYGGTSGSELATAIAHISRLAAESPKLSEDTDCRKQIPSVLSLLKDFGSGAALQLCEILDGWCVRQEP